MIALNTQNNFICMRLGTDFFSTHLRFAFLNNGIHATVATRWVEWQQLQWNDNNFFIKRNSFFINATTFSLTQQLFHWNVGSRNSQISLFSNFFIKNRSYGIIHTFKNYFTIIFFNFQFLVHCTFWYYFQILLYYFS